MITYLEQPKKSRQCGQHCLAMISGKSVEEIVTLIGKNKGTTTQDIIQCLNKIGLKNSGRLVSRRKQALPEVAICKVRREWNKSGGWHWVVLYKGQIYDPEPFFEKGMEAITPLSEYDDFLITVKQKLSSYIEIQI